VYREHRTDAGRALLLVLACAVLWAASTGTAIGAVVYAGGDIACDPTDSALNTNGPGLGSATRCAQMRTSNLMIGQTADAVIALGDLQYNSGTLSNFNAVYDPSWGRLKSITKPVIGNHEGTSATGGAGYCSYFGSAAHCNSSGRQGGAAFYSFDVGAWHVVVLNSNCTAAGGCDVGSPQYQWLADDLATKSTPCTMAVWHHPRWSSGHDGSNAFMHPIWQLFHASGGDLVLAGHSHDYERFAPLDGDGAINATTGMRSFVVGTGGAFFTGLSGAATGSQVRQNTTFGILKLVLNATNYSWTFVPEAGRTFTDSGSQACRTGGGGDTTPPSAPTGLAVTNATADRVDLKWNAASDNVGVTEYRVVRDGTLAGTTNGNLTFSDTAVSPSTNYSYTVQAVDAAGNTSDPSAAVAVTTPPSGGSVRTFLATADATLAQATPTTPNGTGSRLAVDTSPVNDALVKFNLANCTSASNAILRLTVGSSTDDASSSGGAVFGTNNAPWSEATVTWNSAPAKNATATATRNTAVALNQTVSFDVSPLVRGNGEITLRVSGLSSDAVRYLSREAGTDLTDPQLQVGCSTGGGDTQAPTVPGNVTATVVSSTAVDVSWAESTDDVGVTGYRVYRDGVRVATTTGSQRTFSDAGLQPSTTYSYTVDAVDASGKSSGQSAPATVTTPAGTPPPTTLTFAPTDDATIDQSAPTANFGTANRVTVDSSPVNDILMRFTVTGCTSVTAAKLRMTIGSGSTDNSGKGGDFRAAVNSNWSQGTVTWNTAPAAAAGAPVASIVTPVALNTAYLVDVTPIITGNGTYTIRVTGNSSDGARYYSKDGNAATVAPQLQVTCGGTGAALSAAGSASLAFTRVGPLRCDLADARRQA
jgi:chitodextrinase